MQLSFPSSAWKRTTGGSASFTMARSRASHEHAWLEARNEAAILILKSSP